MGSTEAAAGSLTAPVAVAVPSPAPAVATPSPRSDWPAAIRGHAPAATWREREEGTDGLMGRLVFGLPGDTPYPPAATPERRDRFELDGVPTSTHFDPVPLKGRRLGVLGLHFDPIER